MSKYTLLILLLITLFLPLKTSAVTENASIPPIENLNMGQTKDVTVSGLDASRVYVWEIHKYTNTFHMPSVNPYTPFSKDCLSSDNSGKITQTIGPFNTLGYYRIVISKNTGTGGDPCHPYDDRPANQDFSVGGPVGGSVKGDDGLSCCVWSLEGGGLFGDRPIYDRDRDSCKPLNAFLTPGLKERSTQCSNTNPKSFCEPDSLKCFEKQSFVIQGKICLDKNDKNFNKDKNIVCAVAGGKEAKGCTDNASNPGIATAIGCIHTNPTELIKDSLKFVVGIGGGLAFLMMLLGAFQMLTSAGNPETLNAGKERLTSAVIGLLMVIFAILLLQIIGVGILNLPGFKQ